MDHVLASIKIFIELHFYHIFVVFTVFLMKTGMFCFGKFQFLLAVGDTLEQECFHYSGYSLSGKQYYTPDNG